MDKNDIYLVNASKQSTPFSENLPWKIAPNIRIGPGLIYLGLWYSLFL